MLSVPIPIKITGVSAIIKLVKKEGISASLNVLLSNKPLGGFATIFFINSGNTIPAASKAGIATTIPYNKVFPISALNITAIAVGPGCGGKKTVCNRQC